METHLHLVSFTVPYPPDYGGVIDVFYKLKALKESGAKVTLHCFVYKDRKRHAELERYADKVYYYSRKSPVLSYVSTLPYVTSSRASQQLLRNLIINEFPILFEGVHTTAFLGHPLLGGRTKLVRTHNIEWQYYRSLARSSNGKHLRLHYSVEWNKLRSLETTKLTEANALLCISGPDREYFSKYYPGKAELIPPFHRFDGMVARPGRGEYVLFHGDLSVQENIDVVYFLAQEVWPSLPFRLIIAGRNPHPGIRRILEGHKNIELRANVSSSEMDNLMKNAQLQIVHSTQTAGFKLKLLHALYTSRFCLCNRDLAAASGMEDIVKSYTSAAELKDLVGECMELSVGKDALELRERMLMPAFDNRQNAQKILGLLD